MSPSHWPVRLTHNGVTLRPLRRRDEPAWARIRQRSVSWFHPWDSTRPANAPEPGLTFAKMVTQFSARARRGQMLPWAVEYIPAGTKKPIFVGQVTVSGITRGSACWAQIGYWIDPRWAGRGIVPTAVAMATDYCFTTLGLHRMEVAIRPENSNSLAVVRKLGFRYEGRRERYMHVDGEWRDHEMFVLTPEEVPEGVLARYERNAGRSPG
ncbi:MAG TPA: GNAT family protein [Propionicimonas sp.]|nr:GNAT family protein [Propionicimonas sp.]HRA07505.1 GNAT family protein [Propionicimonas sp.]